MAEETRGSKPADFFVGLVDFFAILLPGAILAFWLYRCMEWDVALSGLLPPPPEGIIQVALYAVGAYVLGHLIYVIGSLCLDPLYDWWKESLEPKSLTDLRNGVKESQWNADVKEIAVCLRLWSAGATSEMERLEADQKFFRGLIIVLLVAWPLFLWSWGHFNWAWLGLAVLVVPVVFGRVFEGWSDQLKKGREGLEQQQQENKQTDETAKQAKQRLKSVQDSKEKWRKQVQLVALGVVVIGYVAWLGYWACSAPTQLTKPSAEVATPCPESTKKDAKVSPTANETITPVSQTTALVKRETRVPTGEAVTSREVPRHLASAHRQAPPVELGSASPMSPDASGSTGPEKSAPKQAAAVCLDKRWVAGFLMLGLLLSAVRFGQQRVKYTEFLYRAYMICKTDLEGPSRRPLGT